MRDDHITDAAFVHLRGIQSLKMACSCQVTITGATFMNLRGIRSLDTSLTFNYALQAAAAAVLALGSEVTPVALLAGL